MKKWRDQTFSSLKVPNYALYTKGQGISLIGTWMQTIAQSWLVYELTNSATMVGIVVAVQMVPVLFLGPYGGVIADRVDKRKLMIALQTMMGALALVQGILVITHLIALWQIFILAALLGMNNAFENPARQSFVLEMVGSKDLRNAVTLNSVLVNGARTVGPAVAGVLIELVGTGPCFILNALSFVVVVITLNRLDLSALQPSVPTAKAKGQLVEGLRYVKSEPRLAVPLVMMALMGTFAYEFQVVLPSVAKVVFSGGAGTLGLLTSSMGVGAVIGGLVVAGRGKTGLRPLTIAAGGFGVLMFAASLAPTLWLEVLALALLGGANVSFLAIGNSTLQLSSPANMRGRVMSLWQVAFLGSTPIGGPVVGFIAQELSGRWALAVGATSCIVAAGIGVKGLQAARRLAARKVDDAPVGLEIPTPVAA